MPKIGKLKTNKGDNLLSLVWRYPKNYTDTVNASFEKINIEEEYHIKRTLGNNEEMKLIKQ
jgi:hypothetical protein